MIEIAPSIMAADYLRLGEEIAAAERGGADLFHLDIMDGHFVPNLTFGPDLSAAVAKAAKVPTEAHLMIDEPERYAEQFVRAGGQWVIVHPEAPGDAAGAMEKIRALGARPGIAINPETPFASCRELAEKSDVVLIMSVHPGFYGQKFMPEVLEKFAEARAVVKPGTILAIDGGINVETIATAAAAGPTRFVAGAAVFSQPDVAAAVKSLRQAAEAKA